MKPLLLSLILILGFTNIYSQIFIASEGTSIQITNSEYRIINNINPGIKIGNTREEAITTIVDLINFLNEYNYNNPLPKREVVLNNITYNCLHYGYKILLYNDDYSVWIFINDINPCLDYLIGLYNER